MLSVLLLDVHADALLPHGKDNQETLHEIFDTRLVLPVFSM